MRVYFTAFLSKNGTAQFKLFLKPVYSCSLHTKNENWWGINPWKTGFIMETVIDPKYNIKNTILYNTKPRAWDRVSAVTSDWHTNPTPQSQLIVIFWDVFFLHGKKSGYVIQKPHAAKLHRTSTQIFLIHSQVQSQYSVK